MTNFRVEFSIQRRKRERKKETHGALNVFKMIFMRPDLSFLRYLIKLFNYLLGSTAKASENWTDINMPHINLTVYFQLPFVKLDCGAVWPAHHAYYILIYISNSAICLAMIYNKNLWLKWSVKSERQKKSNNNNNNKKQS